MSLALLAIMACSQEAPHLAADRVNLLADGYIAAYFDAFPEEATLAGVAAGPHDRLTDLSPAARERWHATQDSMLADLEDIDPTRLPETGTSAITWAFLSDVVHNAVAFRACRMELWNVSPTWTGWQSVMALLASSQPVGSPEQNDAALRRFSELPRYLDQEMQNLTEGLRLGYSAPKHNVESVITQMESLLAAPVAESPFVAMAPDSLPDLRARMLELETSQLRPAFTRYRDFLRDTYLPLARAAVGVSANPQGDVCYRAAVRWHATVYLTPDSIRATGLAQMAEIRAQMQEIAERAFGTTDVSDALRQLRTDPRYLMRDRDEMLLVAQNAVDRAHGALAPWFGHVPDAPVVVEPVPAFSEASAPGGFYNPPSDDGSRPGVYYINLYQASTQPRAGLESTAFHETWPGHHLQGAIALERTDLHPISRYMFLSGFGEGWGLYAERLAGEMGLFSTDVDRMGMLSAEAHRAARLVVDAGMHALGLTRQQAIEYLLQNTALNEASATAEIDRYIAVPGQATSYMLGNLEIRRLRILAEERLGDRFDIRAFHDRILEDGPMPLSTLARKIERWLDESTP
jgi:uncharacterized protein (DUF885 family)